MGPKEDTAPTAPAGVDTDKPSAARIYDWYLGGTHNWAVDREFGKRAVQLWPGMPAMARQNRAFMNRVVEAALDAGIRQFIDLGSGVPTVGNVHEIIRRKVPEDEDATVVYVDYEPVAAAHSTVILEKDEATDWAGLVQRDLRDPDAIFEDDTTRALIDFAEPVCVMLIAVMHFIGPHDQPAQIVETYRSRVAPGSWLAISHASIENAPEEDTVGVRQMIANYRNTSNPMWLRDRAEFAPWFGDWTMLDPGITRLPDWRPDEEPDDDIRKASVFGWGGVAEKPRP
ncbi:SAM-dependent methyltransferase [Amycolatopsis sp. H6(2020)]|nr:SAM-dependent methyltransferase [Amycolatopsis sp. H6(2020)]